ncbi:hypothetical protein TorRG33x02_122800 [Trema orientale]|uniref:Pectinesterase inhibitor domain containing protein n=1 Tax=Trema orientale TaxID=63057 RepID=A0A2P5F2G8_TREOI|nr:hypothetical protein TorRG33x02_122800 [Trema orientale]
MMKNNVITSSSSTRFLLVVLVVGAISTSTTCDAERQRLSGNDVDLRTCVYILRERVDPQLMETHRRKICAAVIDGRLGTNVPSCLDQLIKNSDILGYPLNYPIAIDACTVIFNEILGTAQLHLFASS